MAQVPSIVIVSSSNTKPKSLIKLITKQTDLTEDESDPNKICHSWKIDTKYYTADVHIYGITEQYERGEEFNNCVEALIIHVDTNKESGLEDLKVWESIDRDCEPDIKILLTNYCTNETKITRARATEWCLKRGYELIELYPSNKTKDNDEQDIIEERVGVERVVEVLQTHVWTNLVMKDNKPKKKNAKSCENGNKQVVAKNAEISLENTCKGSENIKSSGKQKSGEVITKSIPEKMEEDVADLERLLSGEGTDDFTELFSQLQMMKESLQSLPMRERKQCAEQMVTAFWRAIGGDEEEIADI